MKRWTLIILGALMIQASPQTQAQVPNLPACAQGCCTKDGQMGGKNKEECATYCHFIFDSMARQGTPKDQVAATGDTNSAIARLAQCKNACVHNCKG